MNFVRRESSTLSVTCSKHFAFKPLANRIIEVVTCEIRCCLKCEFHFTPIWIQSWKPREITSIFQIEYGFDVYIRANGLFYSLTHSRSLINIQLLYFNGKSSRRRIQVNKKCRWNFQILTTADLRSVHPTNA